MGYKLAALLVILLLVSVGLNIFLFQKKQTPAVPTLPTYKVLGVYDGDTFVIEGKRRVRLRQAGAPELNECGGEKQEQL